jgi:exopolyphosphatase / guanosine-5'-triphosphate,3'-diphosphate pyrophosphatase
MTRRVAAIDCGTNSLRLLIADVDPAAATLSDVERRMEIVRLGQGVDATGRLAAEALERTFVVLAGYASQISEANAARVRMVATSATRDASNAAEFALGVRAILGVQAEVITGEEEARLSFTGATAELAGRGAVGSADADHGGTGPRLEPPYLVVDIGGGSTEFVLGGGQAAGPAERTGLRTGSDPGTGAELAAISVDIGSVRLTERRLHSDPPSGAEILAARADIDKALDDVEAAIAVSSARTLVGLAGSVTTLTAVALGLESYDPALTHHARLPVSLVREVTGRLLSQSRAERARIGAIHPGRVDVIGAGALILDQLMERFGFGELVTSEHDILDGIAWSIAADG